MKKLYLGYFLAIIGQIKITFAVTPFLCYDCASPKLYNDWPKLTFLPRRPAPVVINDLCNSNPIVLAALGGSVSCTTACYTMILELRDGTAQYVRGCHDSISKDGSFMVQPTKCEYGYVTRKYDNGDVVKTQAQLEFCKTANCNGARTGFRSTDKACTDTGPAPTTCQECNNCNMPGAKLDATCTARWCYSNYEILDSRISVTKGCMPINVYGTDACTELRDIFPAKPGYPALDYYAKQCFCNKQGSAQSCNAVNKAPDYCKRFVLMADSVLPVSFLCTQNNRGTCVNNENGAYCQCKDKTYTGTFCEKGGITPITTTAKPCGASTIVVQISVFAFGLFLAKVYA